MASGETMRTDGSADAGPGAGAPPPAGPAVSWLPWLAWAWVGYLVLAALAEVLGLEALRLALDFQRHLR